VPAKPERDRRLARGMCSACGTRPFVNGTTYCQVHLDYFAAIEPIRKEQRRLRRQKPETKVQMSNNGHKRRLKLGAAFVEKVDVLVLFKRDKGICQLCGKRVFKAVKSPANGAKSIDHIVPVELGGDHSYANTQLAHRGCNSRKRDRLEKELPWLWDKKRAAILKEAA
jgi:5-methylcytosine-specific restriction endonuclease McrA